MHLIVKDRRQKRVSLWSMLVLPVIAVLLVFVNGTSHAQDQDEETPPELYLEDFKDKKFIEENAGANVQGQSIGLVEWSIDQGQTWHPSNGKNAQAIPPVKQHTNIGFRAHKSNPNLPWPDRPFKPTWRVMEYEQKPVNHIGDTVWVLFSNVVPKEELNGTVAAECGNRIIIPVIEVVPEDE